MSKKIAPSKAAAKNIKAENYETKVDYAERLIRERDAAQRIVDECNDQLETVDCARSFIDPDGQLQEA